MALSSIQSIRTMCCIPSASATTAARPSMQSAQTATRPLSCPELSTRWSTATQRPIRRIRTPMASAAQLPRSMRSQEMIPACWSWRPSSLQARASSSSPAQPSCRTSRCRPRSKTAARRRTTPTTRSARISSPCSTRPRSPRSRMCRQSQRRASSSPWRAS